MNSGSNPSQSLQQLEQSVLRQDPGLELEDGSSQAAEAPTASSGEPTQRSLLIVPHEEDNIDALLRLAAVLARKPERELILVRLAGADEDLAGVTAAAQERRTELERSGVAARAAAFVSADPGRDVLRLASDQEADVLLCDAPGQLVKSGEVTGLATALLGDAPCEVGLLARRCPLALDGDRPVMVPVGGADHEWAAVELGAWLARASGTQLVLLGTAADKEIGSSDASRLLAHSSLATQKGLGISAVPKLVREGMKALLRHRRKRDCSSSGSPTAGVRAGSARRDNPCCSGLPSRRCWFGAVFAPAVLRQRIRSPASRGRCPENSGKSSHLRAVPAAGRRPCPLLVLYRTSY